MSEWKTIDSAPKGKLLIIYWPTVEDANGRNRLVEMIRVDFVGNTPHRKPTHWMPLPEPPK